LVEWAWKSQSRLALLAREWFSHGLEPAQPSRHDLAPPAEPRAP
jgi:hypothetical protein